MIDIKLPSAPVYDELFGIDEKYRDEVKYIRNSEIDPYKLSPNKGFFDVNHKLFPTSISKNKEYGKYYRLLKKYRRIEKVLNKLKKCRDYCKEGLKEWYLILFSAIISPVSWFLLLPIYWVVSFVLSFFGVNIPDKGLYAVLCSPIGCCFAYLIGIIIGFLFSQLFVCFFDRKLSDRVLKKQVLIGDLPSKKVALEILHKREDERYAIVVEKYNAEIDELEKKFPGLKAAKCNIVEYSKQVYLRELDIFIGILVEIIKKCNSLHTKHWWEKIDPESFEIEVANWFVQKGYKADTTQYSGDGGVDIVLEKDGVREFVQCKHYLDQKVPVATVREFFGVMASEKVEKGYIVSLVGLTQGALEFAYKNNIKSVTVNDLSVDAKKVYYNSEVKKSDYKDTLLNRCVVGAYVGNCFIYGDIFDDIRLAKESLENRKVLDDQWAFILSSKDSYYSSDYYVIVRCPLSMKNDILNIRKVMGK